MNRDKGSSTGVDARRGDEKLAIAERTRRLRVAAPAVVVVAVVVALWVMHARTLASAVAVIALAFGLASLALHAKRLAEQRSEEAPDPVRMQKRALSRCQYLEAVDPAMAEKALAQFDQNEDRLKKFTAGLGAKFEAGELTYQRYLSAAEHLHAAVFENLNEVAAMLNNLDSLKVRAARQELVELEQRSQPSDDEARLVSGLRERLAIADRTEAEIRSRLSYNEEALTELDRVNLAISSIKTSKSTSNVDLEAAMSELRELAERAKKYSS